MPTLLHSAHPAARKVHRCNCCTGEILAGTAYCRETYVYDGHVYDWKACAGCEPLNDVVWSWVSRYADEGIDQDDYIEWARDHRDDPNHGEAARALLVRAGQPVEGGGTDAA